MSSIMFRVMS